MATFTTDRRDAHESMKRVQSELADLRKERNTLTERRDQARTAAQNVRSVETRVALTEAERELGEVNDLIARAEGHQQALLSQLSDGQRGSAQRSGEVGALVDRVRDLAPPFAGSGAMWRPEGLDDPEIRAQLSTMATSKMPVGRVSLGQMINRDALVADISGTDSMRRGDYLGVVPALRRALRVLDLIPTGTMNGNTVPYTQEGGTYGALETAEGTTKPQDGGTFTDQTAEAATIAVWQALRKQALSDFPLLQSIITGRLQYSVMMRLEDEVLRGDGTGANILGVLNTTGIGVVTFDATKLKADLLLDGIVGILLANAEANGIVVHPLDWKDLLTARSMYTASGSGDSAVTGGSGEYIGGGPFSVTPAQIWGVPLIPSVAIPQGTALVGDFGRGAMLFIRESVNALLSDADGNDFTQNRVKILAEMRAALAVFRPTAFTTVELAAS